MEFETQDNYTCKEVLTKQDRLNVIGQMYDFVNDSSSIWHLASCNSKYNPVEMRLNKSLFVTASAPLIAAASN